MGVNILNFSCKGCVRAIDAYASMSLEYESPVGRLSLPRHTERTNGDRNVPCDAIASYFAVQIASGRRDGREDVAAALAGILSQWVSK